MSREAVRKICRVFTELYVSLEKENKAWKDEVKHLKSELKNQENFAAKNCQTQTLYKIKPAGWCPKRHRECEGREPEHILT